MYERFPYIGPETDPIPQDSDGDVYSIRGHGKNLIREIRGGIGTDPIVLEGEVKKIRELFNNFEERTGIKVVKTQYIIKKDIFDVNYYRIDAFSEKIEGDNLFQIDWFDKDQSKKIEELLNKLFEYFKKSYNNKQPLLSDIFSPGQFVLGTRQCETQEEIFLVDIDPIIETEYEANNIFFIVECLDDLMDFCKTM